MTMNLDQLEGYRPGKATLRGLEFSFLEWGDPNSPPMVLLHGLTGHAHTWDLFANSLKDEYHIFALDQRGHGDTGWADPPQYNTEDFVEDVRELARHWGISRFTLIGLSMGAHNALDFASRHPEMVDRLVPVDIGPSLPSLRDPERQARWDPLYQDFDTLDEAYADAVESNPIADPEVIKYRVRHNLKRTDDGRWTPKCTRDVALNWKPDDLSETIKEIQCPTLIVRGGVSDVLSVEVAESMRTAIPDCELATIAGSGHSVPQDKPADFEAAVREFLSS
ncbi:MAG: alpha/beta hydrolase [Dehalococcoidia bacterium]|nr:alpha/beta hydrolase [Dehalococcoidia bacterium]